MASLTALELSCAELSVRELNTALRELPDGTVVNVTEPRGRHNLAVGLSNKLEITIAGNAGYFIGGLCDGPHIAVDGFVGWSVAENLMSGIVRVRGNASECAGASARGHRCHRGGRVVARRHLAQGRHDRGGRRRRPHERFHGPGGHAAGGR